MKIWNQFDFGGSCKMYYKMCTLEDIKGDHILIYKVYEALNEN